MKSIGYTPNQSNTTACLNSRKETLLDDIVAVEISASPYATEILAESPMYTWVDLISSIGGQTGEVIINKQNLFVYWNFIFRTLDWC